MLGNLYYLFGKLHNSLNTKIDDTIILYLMKGKICYNK